MSRGAGTNGDRAGDSSRSARGHVGDGKAAPLVESDVGGATRFGLIAAGDGARGAGSTTSKPVSGLRGGSHSWCCWPA